KPIHTSRKVDISDCSPIHILDSTQINPVKMYDDPEENINAMRSAIDDDS
ncbi:17455_t:CDS:1, partial [Gigaspora rosea]